MSNLIGCDAILVGGGGGGTPTVLDEFHYVASDVVESGGAVSQMNDQSGNDNHAVQSNGAYQPTLTLSDSDFNNQPSLVFSGDSFETLKGVKVANIGGFCLFFVAKLGVSDRFFILGHAGNNRVGFFNDLTSIRNDYQRPLVSVINAISYKNTNAVIWTFRSDATNFYVDVNGVNIGSNTTNPLDGVYSSFGVYSGGLQSTGKMAECRIKNEHNLTDINSIGSALATKYGFTWNTIT